MSLKIITGLPGASKSYMTAQINVDIVKRNMKWYKESGIRRILRTNLKMSEQFEQFCGFGTPESFIEYWEDPAELPGFKNCDVTWEEMGSHVNSRNWDELPLELRRWIQQHRHRGVEIIGNCQDFADVDVAVRRCTENLLYLTKIIGSRDPSPTSKPPKYIWGIVLKMYLDPRQYNEQTKLKDGQFGGFEFITREGVNLFSMFNDIKPAKYPPLQHRSRICPDCGYVKVTHV